MLSQDTTLRQALKIHFKNKSNCELRDISDLRDYEQLITRSSAKQNMPDAS